MSQLFASGGQSIGVSVSAPVLLVNTQELISLRTDWFDLLAVQGTLKILQHLPWEGALLLILIKATFRLQGAPFSDLHKQGVAGGYASLP